MAGGVALGDGEMGGPVVPGVGEAMAVGAPDGAGVLLGVEPHATARRAHAVVAAEARVVGLTRVERRVS